MTSGLITFDQYVQEKGFDNKTVNRFWKYCNQDIPSKETGQIEWWGREATNHNDMQGYPEEFDDLFEGFKNINSSRQIKSAWATDNAIRDEGWDAFNRGLSQSDNPYKFWKGQGEEQQYNDWDEGWEAAYYNSTYLNSSKQITSANSQEEFEDLIIDIEDKLGVNVEHSNIFNLNSELSDDIEMEIDDLCRRHNCKFVPVNGDRRQYRLISSRRNNMIKSSPNFRKYTADDIFDTFNVSQLTGTVFMDREECKNAKCGMEEFTDLMWEVAPTWLGVQNPDDVREVCRRAKNPQAKAFLEAFETAMENAKFTDKFYDSVTVHKKRNVQSSRRIQSMRTPKNVYLNEDTQKLIQRLEKRVGHELKLKFEEDNTPYVEIEKLPKGGYSFITEKYLNNLAEHFLYDGYKEKQDSFIVYLDPAIMYTRPGIKSAYTREDYDRFDEVGNFIPYKPTEEELAKKDEIKTVLKQELSDAYEPDPMDDYVGYDSTNERIDMACERVAKQFGVDTDFVEDIAGEIQNEDYARQNAEAEYIYEHSKDKDRFWDWQNGEDVSLEELGIDKEQMDKEVDEVVRKYVNSSRQIKSALDTVKVTFDNGDTIVTDYNADVGREEIAKYYMHNYFNVGNEDEMHQVVKVEFPGNINSARVPEKADLDMAYQLEGYIESDHAMYDQFIVPVVKNLERKMKRGIFDYDKSLILWQHVADEGAKRYVKELGGPAYNVATRKEVAKNLAEYYKENYDVNGDIYNPIN